MSLLTATEIGDRIAAVDGIVGDDRARLIHRVRHMAKSETLRNVGAPLDDRGTLGLEIGELWRARILLAASYLSFDSKVVGGLLDTARHTDFPITSRGGVYDAAEAVRRGLKATFEIRLYRAPSIVGLYQLGGRTAEDAAFAPTLEAVLGRGQPQAVARFDLNELLRGLV